jgi:hypothetical protein
MTANRAQASPNNVGRLLFMEVLLEEGDILAALTHLLNAIKQKKFRKALFLNIIETVSPQEGSNHQGDPGDGHEPGTR